MEFKLDGRWLREVKKSAAELLNLGVIKKDGTDHVINASLVDVEKCGDRSIVNFILKRKGEIWVRWHEDSGEFTVQVFLVKGLMVGGSGRYEISLGAYSEFSDILLKVASGWKGWWNYRVSSPIVQVPVKKSSNNLISSLVGGVIVGTREVNIRPYLKVLLHRVELLERVLKGKIEFGI